MVHVEASLLWFSKSQTTNTRRHLSPVASNAWQLESSKPMYGKLLCLVQRILELCDNCHDANRGSQCTHLQLRLFSKGLALSQEWKSFLHKFCKKLSRTKQVVGEFRTTQKPRRSEFWKDVEQKALRIPEKSSSICQSAVRQTSFASQRSFCWHWQRWQTMENPESVWITMNYGNVSDCQKRFCCSRPPLSARQSDKML